ncbi:hypothetical protein [Stenotrophomonas acidaminiphila]
MATLKELQALGKKKQDELDAIQKQIDDAKEKEAEKTFTEVHETIKEYKDAFSLKHRRALAKLLGFEKEVVEADGAEPKSSKTTGPKPEKKDYILNDGKNTPFTYGGKGRKPDILKHFEESEKGKKLIADGKATYTLANAPKEAPKVDPKDSEKGKEPAKA